MRLTKIHSPSYGSVGAITNLSTSPQGMRLGSRRPPSRSVRYLRSDTRPKDGNMEEVEEHINVPRRTSAIRAIGGIRQLDPVRTVNDEGLLVIPARLRLAPSRRQPAGRVEVR